MGCHHSAWTLSALTTTPVVATRDHPLADVHTVVLADPNFAAQAYYALPHLFNVIMAHHMTGVNMSNIMDNLDGLVRVACTVPGLQQTGILHQVLSLARGVPPFRAMLRIWTTAQCALALRLDHLVHVAVPLGKKMLSTTAFVAVWLGWRYNPCVHIASSGCTPHHVRCMRHAATNWRSRTSAAQSR